jgi:hypothetical protein
MKNTYQTNNYGCHEKRQLPERLVVPRQLLDRLWLSCRGGVRGSDSPSQRSCRDPDAVSFLYINPLAMTTDGTT